MAAPVPTLDPRQILRWLFRDVREFNRRLHEFLISALHDQDWELRASAMLGVALYEAWYLLPLVKPLVWNRQSPDNGQTRADTAILQKWHDAVLHRAPVHRTDPRDHETMLLYALINPLDGVELGSLPHRAGYRFIAPIPHWIGDDRPVMKFPNPIRRIQPAEGFWLSESRCAEGTFAVALAEADAQARRSGLAVRLPTADEWEIAARGADGRFFPWGNGMQPDALDVPSPWGLERLMENKGEWCIASVEDPRPVLCGSSRKLGVPARVLDAPTTFAAGYRFHVRFPD